MDCQYKNVRIWCYMAKNEDSINCVFGNYRYDINNEYIGDWQLKGFENVLLDMANEKEILDFSFEYIEEACWRDSKICFGSTELDFPDDGVTRIMVHTVFYREFKSFIGGITASHTEAEDLFNNFMIDEQKALNYINAKVNQDEAEKYAKDYMRAMNDIDSDGASDYPSNYSDISELDDDKIVWVFKKKFSTKGIERYSKRKNCANYFINNLSLFYPGIFSDNNYKLVLLRFIPAISGKVLHKPTVFSGGYPLGYCSVPSSGGWGSTMVFNNSALGISEAITKRKYLGYAFQAKFIGNTNKDSDPVITHPINEVVARKLGYMSNIIDMDNCQICDKYK